MWQHSLDDELDSIKRVDYKQVFQEVSLIFSSSIFFVFRIHIYINPLSFFSFSTYAYIFNGL
jgi:hypothetical protein